MRQPFDVLFAHHDFLIVRALLVFVQLGYQPRIVFFVYLAREFVHLAQRVAEFRYFLHAFVREFHIVGFQLRAVLRYVFRIVADSLDIAHRVIRRRHHVRVLRRYVRSRQLHQKLGYLSVKIIQFLFVALYRRYSAFVRVHRRIQRGVEIAFRDRKHIEYQINLTFHKRHNTH